MLRGLHFSLPPDDGGLARVKHAKLIGSDRMPWPSAVQIDERRFSVLRDIYESGSVQVPWAVREFGELVVQTSTLMPRDQPYCFSLELARGEINRVRNQVADWEQQGLRIPEAAEALLRIANQSLLHAIRTPCDSEDGAAAALSAAIACGELVAGDYGRQAIAARRRRDAMASGVGCTFDDLLFELPETIAFNKFFDHITIPVDWPLLEPLSGERNWDLLDRRIQWCRERNLSVGLGPLVDFRTGGLPSWVLANNEPQVIFLLLLDLVESCVDRFRGRVEHWETTARTNSISMSGVSEEQMLWLTGRLIEAVNELSPKSQICWTLGQPWGDYLGAGRRRYSPFSFADQISRSDLPPAAMNLEIAMGYPTTGSRCRSTLGFSQLLDHYHELGLPLHVRLFFPSASPPLENGKTPGSATVWRGEPTDDVQADWLESFVTVALAKSFVERVSWGRINDRADGPWPLAGLIDAEGRPKRAMKRLRAVCRACFR